MPKSALPPNYVIGSDNRNWLMKLKKRCQIWLAAGPRVPRGVFKWRDIPMTLLAYFGKGVSRWENTDGTEIKQYRSGLFYRRPYMWWGYQEPYYYISRIQPWAKWGLVLQWPLFLNIWFIYIQKDVVEPPTYRSAFGISRMFTLGMGFKRDSDKVYWLTCNLGGNFE